MRVLLSVGPPGTSGEGPPSGGGDPRAGRPGGGGGPAGVRASLGLRFQARRDGWGPRSRNSLPAPGWEGAQSFHQGRPPLRPLCPALSHMVEPGVGSDPDSAPPAEAGLLGGRQRGRKRGLWVIWEEQSRGEHRLGILDLPCAREPVWGPHAPTCGMEEPLPPGTESGGRAPSLARAEPSTGAAIISTSAGPPAGVKVSWPVVTSATSSPCVSELVGLTLLGTL